MGYLYILSEGERDELFYELIAERVTGRVFEHPSDFRLRRGANWKTALAGGRMLLNRFKHWKGRQGVAVILAVDNDRAPGHPGSLPHPRPLVGRDLKKSPRYPEVVKMIAEAFGSDRVTWPVDVALAMPVEMIESWVLLLCDPQRPTLPLFAEKIQWSARAYYGAEPPPQLKDACKAEAAALGKTLDDYFWHAAEQDIEAVTVASPSFKMFVDEIRQWRCPTAN
ncbi:MAG TPA: hypothetical protein VIT91_03095 [Chthoniobacterales bacterium]